MTEEEKHEELNQKIEESKIDEISQVLLLVAKFVVEEDRKNRNKDSWLKILQDGATYGASPKKLDRHLLFRINAKSPLWLSTCQRGTLICPEAISYFFEPDKNLGISLIS